jgi:hypothetical protein
MLALDLVPRCGWILHRLVMWLAGRLAVAVIGPQLLSRYTVLSLLEGSAGKLARSLSDHGLYEVFSALSVHQRIDHV